MFDEKIIGIVKQIIFSSESNFTIAKIKVEDELFDITIKGIMKIGLKNKYEFFGSYKSDERYGEYFAVQKYKRPELVDGEEVIKYLSSKQFEGIGKRTATKIYKEFGQETLNIIKTNPNKLLEIGINESIVMELSNKHTDDNLLADLYEQLEKLSFSDFLIQEIYKYLEGNVSGNKITYLLENPYLLISKIHAMTFSKADEIYLANNGKFNDDTRCIYLLVDIINNHCNNNGDTVMEINLAEEKFNVKTNLNNEFNVILNLAINEKKIIDLDDAITTNEFYYVEHSIAQNINLRLGLPTISLIEENIISEIYKLEKELQINYSNVQKDAIKQALLTNLFIITGGPGTGKTTIIKAIVIIYDRLKFGDEAIKERSNHIMLCAPTGRAAQRMKEATGYSAKTIHSLLGWDPYTNKFERSLESPLNQELFVIDEFSMVDVFLANSLLKAIKPNAIIIIVGDKAQLESVSPGKILSDLLDYDKIPRVKLNVIYRQGEGSTIASLAKQIDNEDKIELINTNDMSIIERNGTLVENICTIYQKSISAGYSPLDVQILYPKYRGKNGIDALNEALKPKLTKESIYIKHNDITYQVGDKIMQLKNDGDRNIYNGDIGSISKIINPNAKGKGLLLEIKIREKFIDVTRSQMDDITHAYAISIHKSQGSEFKVIILPITSEAQNMLSKKLIYTAVTRTKDKLIILGEMERFYQGVSEFDYLRNTRLKKYLNEYEIKNIKSPYDFL